ncbi:MAG: hypothetical protein A2113_03480 [Candidatus Woykebacteria bacterium GWA1_44_8]|uniref:Dockerin domain-containing protein n=1 Tax=Candidatus Woykebacteria bacterium GWA1_44_8 TaxID=1802591 RepID=A0A1G1W3C3_9BACT|nr:MAG: hypothetical protein A2113_03480 [Candidatus Woykebacteria bacterium GWA1_44_8]
MIFNKDLFPPDNPSVIYAPAASKIFPQYATYEAAFDSTNRMVVGFNPYGGGNPSPDGKSPGRFPAVFNDPLSASTTPDAFLKDYHSMQSSVAFDDDDNLYVGDNNRTRVLIYKKPFGTGGPPPKPGDLNGDDQVDIFDLSILLSSWGASGGVADINNDGTVNIFDLSILLSNWGT